MFQKFMADPAQDINALLAETQTAHRGGLREPVDGASRGLPDETRLHDLDAGVALVAIPASAPLLSDYHRDGQHEDRRTVTGTRA